MIKRHIFYNIRKLKFFLEVKNTSLKMYDDGRLTYSLKQCKKCNIFQFPRTKHCIICKLCIDEIGFHFYFFII